MLQRLLVADFQRRTGGELTEKQRARLEKTVDHYMEQVYSDPASNALSVPVMNKEVLQAVVPDFMSYLKRQDSQARPQSESEMDRIREDVTTRFDKMQAARQEGKAALPAPPKFQLSLEDDATGPSAMSRFEEMRKQRETEAKRQQEEAAVGAVNAATAAAKLIADERPMPEDMRRQIASDDEFRLSQRQATAATETALSQRNAARSVRFEEARNEILSVPPDPRSYFFGEGVKPPFGGPRGLGLAQANPTLALPDSVRTRPVLPQDVIKSQDDVITYRENEYNLFIYSADRDWVNNTKENRYQFSVNFDPANNRQGFNLSPSTYIKFKNITRIELVKVIMPVEACEILTTKTGSSTYDTTKSINVLSYPYLQVRIDELNTNGYGTNDGLNNAFGVISYDAYWASDSDLKNFGYTRMIPKFLKCQKVYSPTPLATLQKMTIDIQKPDGNTFCTSADALDVSGVVFSNSIRSGSTAPFPPFAWETATAGLSVIDITGTNYTDLSGTSPEFLWINTSTWFNQYTVTQGDRIVLKNLAYPNGFAAVNTAAATDFIDFLTRPEGHVVVDIAYTNYTTAASGTLFFATGSNKLGYSNYIIIRNKFTDPTTGSTSPWNFGGSSTTNTALVNAIRKTSGTGPGLSTGRLLNLSHQIQIIFRVITRDMDTVTKLRPDNL